MRTDKKPVWRALAVLGVLGGAGLVVEAGLPVGSGLHTLLLLFWVCLFHVGLAVWVRRNSEALEAEPPALDVVGRPIIDNGAATFAVATSAMEANAAAAKAPDAAFHGGTSVSSEAC